MSPADQVPTIDKQRARLQARIERASARIIDCENEAGRIELRRLNLVDYRRRLSLKLSEISTFELDLK